MRDLPPLPANMDETQYSTDNAGSPTQNEPLARALLDINEKLLGIGKIDKKLEQIRSDFHGELDVIKTELANLTESRNKDSVEIKKLQTSFKSISNDLHKTQEGQVDIQKKLEKLDCTSNKNLERINRLEQSNAKLSDNMKRLEERENCRPVETRARDMEVQKDKVTEVDRMNKNNTNRVLSYNYQLNKGLDGLRAHSMLKELKRAQELRIGQEDRSKETNTSSMMISKHGPRLNVDLFGEARRCIGLHPVKARHILEFHDGPYNLTADDIPQQHELRNMAAKEFLTDELK